MTQSATHLDGEVVGVLPRRREDRFACIKPIYLRPVSRASGEKFVYSRLEDCSNHGVCVLTSAPLQLRDQFLLKVRLERLMLVLYTVRNCSEGDYANYRIGAEFTEVVGVSQIDAAKAVMETLLAMPAKHRATKAPQIGGYPR